MKWYDNVFHEDLSEASVNIFGGRQYVAYLHQLPAYHPAVKLFRKVTQGILTPEY